MELFQVSQNRRSDLPNIPNSMKFLFGGLSGMSGCLVVQPLDVVKLRLQVDGVGSQQKEYASTWDCVRKIYLKDGLPAFYKGIGAAILRQATYTTTRVGIYTYLVQKYQSKFQENPRVFGSILMASVAGAVGACAGAPAEIVLVRMAADSKLPVEVRRNYKNLIDALKRIVREEGPMTLFRGNMPTVIRAIITNMVQLSSYSQFKLLLQSEPLNMQEGTRSQFVASVMSAVLTAVTTAPFDVLKTRLQQMRVVNGVPEYRGAVDCLQKMLKSEGVLSLWKGFQPFFLRAAVHTIMMFYVLEALNRLYYKHVWGIDIKGSSI